MSILYRLPYTGRIGEIMTDTPVEKPKEEMTDATRKFIEKHSVKSQRSSQSRFVPIINHIYHNMALLEEPNWSVESALGYGPSVAVPLVNLDDGERCTWWFSSLNPSDGLSILHENLRSVLDAAKGEGHHYPIHLNFVVHENIARKSGRPYKTVASSVVMSGDDVQGNLGVDSRDNPKNDPSIQTDVVEVKPASNPTSNRASGLQWAAIQTLAKEALGDGFTADSLSEYLTKSSEDSFQADELSGEPPAGGLARIGLGTLSRDKAALAITILTEASEA